MTNPRFTFMAVVLQQLTTAGAFVRCALQDHSVARLASRPEVGVCASMCAEVKLWGIDADEAAGLPEVEAQRIAWGVHFVAVPDGRVWMAWHRLSLDLLRSAAEQVGLPDDLNWELISRHGDMANWEAPIFGAVQDAVEQLRTGDERADARLPDFRLGPVGNRVARPGTIERGPGGPLHLAGFMPDADRAVAA